MCGIAGIVSLNGEPIEQSARDRRVIERLRHRGPDDNGAIRAADGLAHFFHTRLSIIDPTPEAAQPMQTANSLLSFNGEIYNFRELAKRFDFPQARSDTHVLQESLERLGRYALPHLEGMFALAHYTERNAEANPLAPAGRILLARDSFGKKPLFYAVVRGRLYFASEVRALVTMLPEMPELEPRAVRAYFAFYSVPAPWTMYKGIFQLPAGSLIELSVPNAESASYWEQSQIMPPTERWWQMPKGSHDKASYGEAVTQTRWLLTRAVERRLVADVEVASLLSGGIDSNAVTAIAQQQSNIKLRTFTLGFEGRNSEDVGLAAVAAKHYGAEHHAVTIRESDLLPLATRFLCTLDAPTGDAFNSWLVAQAVRTAAPDLKVVLSGTGGDELFLGYRKFRFLAKHARAAQLLSALPSQMLSGKARSLAAAAGNPLRARILFGEKERTELLGSTAGEEAIDEVLDLALSAEETDATQQLLRLDLENYLPNMLLHDLDMTTMQFGLEARTPILDRELSLLVWQLPMGIKVRGGTKQLLKDAVKDLLPREILSAKKWGFELPMSAWLRGPLRSLLDAAVSGEMSCVKDRILNKAAVRSEAERFLTGDAHYLRVWSILVFEAWYSSAFESEL